MCALESAPITDDRVAAPRTRTELSVQCGKGSKDDPLYNAKTFKILEVVLVTNHARSSSDLQNLKTFFF